ncbi:MAG: DUF1294 domain-containing protein [Clostridiales bacterium]|nr:DUF1294 domain-containing protein [Clostridiales bacterium]
MINIFEIISWQALLIYIILINIITFILFFLDKFYAKKEMWRISEKTLLISSIIGGSIGALFGMKTFRHKVRKTRFNVGIPVILIIQVVGIGYYLLALFEIIK